MRKAMNREEMKKLKCPECNELIFKQPGDRARMVNGKWLCLDCGVRKGCDEEAA